MRPALIVGSLLLLVTGLAAQRPDFPNGRPLPPISLTCIHHPDVIESRPGSCPLCKMALVPVRLDSAWMCPVHSSITDDRPGACPLCSRQLIRVTTSLTWTCRAQPSVEHLEPGTCADGTPMVMRRTLRPHGNHNPQHGGQFFMAPDNWHHLEGAYPRDRVFRLYLYDDYARPLTPDRLSKVRARVVTKEIFDPSTRKTTELAAFALRVMRGAGYLEARVDRASLPIELTAKVQFEPNAPEHRFDFTFEATTNEPAPIIRTPETSATERPLSSGVAAPIRNARSGGNTSSPRDSGSESQAAGVVRSSNPLEQSSPESTADIVRLLNARNEEIATLIRRGDFPLVWIPAFQAKELGLALAPQLEHLAPAKRQVAEPALQELVRTAWLLDAYADVGNRRQIEAAHAAFTAALNSLVTSVRDSQ
jgi:heavy metal-binding protein